MSEFRENSVIELRNNPHNSGVVLTVLPENYVRPIICKMWDGKVQAFEESALVLSTSPERMEMASELRQIASGLEDNKIRLGEAIARMALLRNKYGSK